MPYGMGGKHALRVALALAVLAFFITPLSPVLGAGSEGGASDPLYVFQGRGRAHGVGLCMDGVLYRAKEGQNYRDIINYYYTGVQFSQTDENKPVRVKCRDGQVRTYPMKEYLYRLAEEPETYPREGLRVLYVAARTYTLSVMDRQKHTAEGYDICSSGSCCQAFDENKDLSKYPNNRAAVDATAGQVITYGGKPIVAAYCGSCGGHTENNEDVWGSTAIPYLRGKPDTYCQNSSRFAWTVNMRKSELDARLNSSGDTSVGSLYSMDLSSRTPGGRVRKAKLTGSTGVKTVSGGTLSGVLGLQSSLFDLAPNNFDEYILVLNPAREPALLTFTFMSPGGESSDHVVEVAGRARYTLKVNDFVQCQDVSTRIVSDRPVVAERAMYFNYGGRRGGSASTGATAPMTRWYFAEGYTAGAFDTYILVQNPGTETAEVKFTFMLPGGGTVVKKADAPPSSRMTVHVDEVPGLKSAEVSTMVESTNGVGIVADRSEYFDYRGLQGGSSEVGSAGPARSWYLAEGYTGGAFDTYVLIQNPSTREVTVDASFMREDGNVVEGTYTVAPLSRYTITADHVPGLESAGFSTRLVSRDSPGIIAERSMYFDYGGRQGGHDGMGVTAPAARWYFGEGYTGGLFDTWVLVQNPNDTSVAIRATFTKPDGSSVKKSYTIGPRSRFTIAVDRIEGLSDAEVATTIEAFGGKGVVAERAEYFDYRNGFDERGGGHNAHGITAPSSTWYFAEGYTGY